MAQRLVGVGVGVDGSLEGQAGEALRHHGVDADRRFPSGVDEHRGVGVASGVESPRGHTTGVVTTSQPGRLGCGDELVEQSDPACVAHRRQGHLDVQRVVGGQLATSTVGDVVDHARGEQLVDQVHLGVRLERRDAERLRQRDGAEQQSCRFAQRAEADLDQLRQSRRRADRTEQHPLAPRFGQHAGLLQAGDQLTQVEQVAARRVAQRRRGHAVDAAGHHTVEQTGHRTQRQRFQVDATEQLVAPQHRHGLGHRFACPQRQDQVGAPAHREVQQQGRGGVVQRVHVVDEQREPGIAVEIAEQMVHRRSEPGRRIGDVGESAQGECLGEGTQRHRRRGPGRPDPHDPR